MRTPPFVQVGRWLGERLMDPYHRYFVHTDLGAQALRGYGLHGLWLWTHLVGSGGAKRAGKK
jgi:hypothetical protein